MKYLSCFFALLAVACTPTAQTKPEKDASKGDAQLLDGAALADQRAAADGDNHDSAVLADSGPDDRHSADRYTADRFSADGYSSADRFSDDTSSPDVATAGDSTVPSDSLASADRANSDTVLVPDSAEIVSHTLPDQMDCNTTQQVTVTVRNTGSNTWTRAAGYKLGTVDDTDPFFSATRVWLEASDLVAPNQSHRFTFTLTAPATPGDHVTDWQMIHEGERWFGQIASSTIAVQCEPAIDATTLNGKMMAGYQGWFATPGDGSQINNWVHWSRGTPAVDSMTIDIWPDISELDADELATTVFELGGGGNAGLYSAYREKTVIRHVQWMKEYGIDGVFVQRFSHSLGDARFFDFKNRVLQNIQAGCQQHGRVFANMYDISGSHEDTVIENVREDWKHLVDTLRITESDRYLHHNGRPVLAIWGFGFRDCWPDDPDRQCPDGLTCVNGACPGAGRFGHPGTPGQVAGLIDWLTTTAPEKYRVTLMGGVPTHWRDLGSDSRSDPAWSAVYRSYDIISPWAVGRYGSAISNNRFSGADNFRTNEIEPDLVECRSQGIDYLPVIFPGFSWYNLRNGTTQLNQTPRHAGGFFWAQAYNAIEAGNNMVYVAMFDEVDEGTAMYKMAASAEQSPTTGTFLTLDADGVAVPSDWYLQIYGEASKMLRGEIPLTYDVPITP